VAVEKRLYEAASVSFTGGHTPQRVPP